MNKTILSLGVVLTSACSVFAAFRPPAVPLVSTVISPEHGIHTFHKWTMNRKECVIDYIAVDKAHAGEFSVSGAWEVPDRMTSDHSPIVVELAFADKNKNEK